MDENEKKSVLTVIEENKGLIIKIAVGGIILGAGALLVRYGLARQAAKALIDNPEVVEAVAEEVIG